MLKTSGIGLSTLSLLHSVLFNDNYHLMGIVTPRRACAQRGKVIGCVFTPRRACAQRGKVIGCVCRYIYMYVCAMQNDKNADLSKNTAIKAMKRGI